ncbi:MAG: phosphatidylserine decarboxylase [Verrucomicrobia bacterium]|nr:phosphatidylserine decarboxylase [Verrucomicrobiota bacterium]
MPHNDQIQFFNRYTGRVETEEVYGAGWLKWIYGHPLGEVALQTFVKRAFFSRWYGRRMSTPASREKIRPFIARYGVDIREFADEVDTFKSFNEFFCRCLKPDVRPVAAAPDVAVFPADGRHFGFADVSEIEGIFVKGEVFDLLSLTQNLELFRQYRRGALVISRLCPVDYHRFHFPVSGKPDNPALINGPLYSVSPIALRRNIDYLAENKRCLSQIESPEFGSVLMVEVGATCVGSLQYTYTPDEPVKKGDEKGYFQFGGSCLLTFFQPGCIQLAADLLASTARGLELYARMGDTMGRAQSA